MDVSVNELISRYLKGDSSSGAKLFDDPEYQRKFKAVIAKYANRNHHINQEDAAQTIKLKIIQALKKGKYNPEWGNFHHWCLTVTRFAMIDLVRKSQRHPTVISLDQNLKGTDIPISETISDDFNLLDSLEKAELINRVKSIIFSLNKSYPQRNYYKLFLAKIAGKTQAEIALDLNITQSAVSKRWKELIFRITEEIQLPSTPLPDDNKKVKSKRSQAKW
jgi:RNA polymerase sigma factor (sigma-70 family)